MTTLVTSLILLLAAVRVTRLIVFDRLSEPLRRWLVEHIGPESMFTYLWFCPWCMGFWVALALSAVAWFPGGLGDYIALPWWAGIPAVAFAASYVIGLTISKED